MHCPECTAANAEPQHGIYMAHCFDCKARMLAHSPRFSEAAEAEALTVGYRDALIVAFGDDWRAGHQRVKHWSERISNTRGDK